jgi:hypothetical protein
MDRYHALMEAELSAFLDARTNPDRRARVPAREMYQAYETWSWTASGSTVAPMSESMFGRLMPKRATRRRLPTGQFYEGLALK